MKFGTGFVRPLSYVDNSGKPAGFEVDVLTEAARRAEVPFTWVHVTGANSAEKDLEDGRIDLMPAGIVTPDRAAKFHISEPWWSVELDLVMRESDSRLVQLGIPGLYAGMARKAFPGVTQVVIDALQQRIAGVCTGDVDGALLTEGDLDDLFLRHQSPPECGGVALQSRNSGMVADLALVARKGDKAIVDRLRGRIDEMALDETLLHMAMRHPSIPTAGALQLENRVQATYRKRFWLGLGLMPIPFVVWFFLDRRRAYQRAKAHSAALQRTHDELTAVFELSPLPLIELDANNGVVRRNRAYLNVFGDFPTEAHIRYELFEIRTPDGTVLQPHQYASNRVLRGEAIHNELCSVKRLDTGAVIHASISAQPVYDPQGRLRGGIMSVYDLTALKKAEADLIRSNEELQAFAYTVSHDLGEPLRSISAFSSLLARRNEKLLDSESLDYLKYVTDATKRMNEMMAGLLEYSRVGLDTQQKVRVDCRAAIETVRHNLALEAEESGAQIQVGELPVVAAWPGRLEQVFQNLIQNAIKYRKPDVRPEIAITAKELAGHWLFAVQDNGIGFDSKYADVVFRTFRQLHARGTYRGTGIGLSIVKRIIERHGGTIRAESEEGTGTTFFFTMPKAQDGGDSAGGAAVL